MVYYDQRPRKTSRVENGKNAFETGKPFPVIDTGEP
jgi:hypothetical protein